MNTLLHGFTEIRQAPLPELDATLHEMEHTQTGARLVWLERDEENKTFGIAFPTLPKDDTGVFHILEHSVLCGSVNIPPQTGQQNGENRSRDTAETSPGVRLQVQAVE